MSVPCEVAVKCVLPVIRAMVAKELKTVDGLRQVDVAKFLRVSQPARHDVSLHEEAILIPSFHISNCDIYMQTLHTLLSLICQGENVEMGN